jgi:hypothetical protein
MNGESTNRDPAESISNGLRDLDQPFSAEPVNPYLPPHENDGDVPPPPKPGYRADIVNDFLTAALIMLANLVGAAVMVPFVMLFAQGNPKMPQMPWAFWLAVQVITYGLFAAFTIPIGVWLGSRVGLDAPVFRGIARGDFSVLNPLRAGWIAAILTGIVGGTIVYLGSLALPDNAMGDNVNQDTIKAITGAPPWVPFLASIGAGITEETWCRFGVMAFLVWSGCLVTNSQRPNTAYVWFCNIAATLPFSAMHIGNLLVIGGEITPASLALIFGANGLIAIICGWLYAKYGIESAMGSHTVCDIAMKVAWPLILPSVT